MFNLKKTISLILSFVLIMSMCCISSYASEYTPPPGLPEGAIKIRDGIYAYTPPIAVYNSKYATISSVPAFGNIIQPNSLNGICIEDGEPWLKISTSRGLYINFVGNGQSIFGSNIFDWVCTGSDFNMVYYVDGPSFGMVEGYGYQTQITSISSAASNVRVSIHSGTR